MIVSPAQAEAFVAAGKADAVSLSGVMLYDPRWRCRVVYKLGAEPAYPRQYERAAPANRADAEHAV